MLYLPARNDVGILQREPIPGFYLGQHTESTICKLQGTHMPCTPESTGVTGLELAARLSTASSCAPFLKAVLRDLDPSLKASMLILQGSVRYV